MNRTEKVKRVQLLQSGMAQLMKITGHMQQQNVPNSILDVNPNALIFIEGVEQSVKSDRPILVGQPDSDRLTHRIFRAWWGGNLRGVRKYPIQPDSGTSQIVYSPHDYGPSVYNQTWFDKDFTEQTLLDDYWYDTWAYVNAEDIAPLLIGEWGGHMDGGKNQQWMDTAAGLHDQPSYQSYFLVLESRTPAIRADFGQALDMTRLPARPI